MTPQEQATYVIGTIQIGDPPDRPLSPVMRVVAAVAIRAAVEAVLYEHPLSTGFKDDLRARFFAIADNIEQAITYAENQSNGN